MNIITSALMLYGSITHKIPSSLHNLVKHSDADTAYIMCIIRGTPPSSPSHQRQNVIFNGILNPFYTSASPHKHDKFLMKIVNTPQLPRKR